MTQSVHKRYKVMKIYYEDKHIVVCEKDAGLLSEGEATDSMPRILSDYFKEKNENSDVFPVHRLDRETSGIMVYARTRAAAAGLSRTITDGGFEKEYIADINGTPTEREGRMDDLLFYDRAKNRSYTVDRKRKGVKDAALEYTVISTENGISRVRIKLLTGRTHQIRVQFASRKMPLIGDRKYGAPKTERTLALRAFSLSFAHPITDEKLYFEDIGSF